MNPTPNKNPKFTGYFRVTESPFGAYHATDFYFLDNGVMIVAGLVSSPSGDKILIELNVALVDGTSKGDFQVTDFDGRPWAFGIHTHSNGSGEFYNADTGTFEMTYIEKISHLTGKSNFISNRDGANEKFAFEFNITQR